MRNSKLKFTEFKDLLPKGYLKTTQKCILQFVGFCVVNTFIAGTEEYFSRRYRNQ